MATTPCIITVAITGSLPRKKDNPAVPISAAEQIESTHEAFEAGATLVHIHVRRDDESPTSDPERFAAVVEGIRRHCPGMITQISTGGRSGAGKERGAMLSVRPDMASLASRPQGTRLRRLIRPVPRELRRNHGGAPGQGARQDPRPRTGALAAFTARSGSTI